MDALTFIREFQRMCNSFGGICLGCPLAGGRTDCDSIREIKNPRERIDVIEKWSAENPVVTNRQMLKEIFGIDTDNQVIKLYDTWLDKEYKAPEDER